MSEIDPISKTLGSLERDAATATEQRGKLFEKTDHILEAITSLTLTVERNTQAGNARLDALDKLHKDCADKHVVIEADIRGLKKFRGRVYLAVAGVGGTGGVLGAVLAKLGFGP